MWKEDIVAYFKEPSQCLGGT